MPLLIIFSIRALRGAEMLFLMFIIAAIFGLGFAAAYSVRGAISRNRRSRAWEVSTAGQRPPR
jgi:hypothetical protein